MSATPPAATATAVPPVDAWASAFDRRVEPVRIRPGYRLAILGVTLLMVLLPLIYLALIAAGIAALVWHATANATIFQASDNIRGAAVIYFAPFAVGGLMIFFMVKPLFAKRARQPKPFVLDPDDQPRLFEFVASLCRAMKAPVPREIRIDTQVNASASFRRGFLSFLGRDLVLTIGMPLAGVLSVRHLTGILAHEFGHFAQGAGMRLTYVVRSINGWFERVVFQRDSWDEKLLAWSKDGTPVSLAVVWISRGFIWVTRKILYGLMMVGHVVSSYLMRQMEFDADRYEVRVSGVDAFEATFRQLGAIDAAWQITRSDLEHYWKDGRLPDDLTKYVALEESRLGDDLRRQIDEQLDARETRRFDTHPSMSRRVASALAEGDAGIFHVDAPARMLFDDFDELSRAVTAHYYQLLLGRGFRKDLLFAVDDLQRRKGDVRRSYESLDRYFFGKLLTGRSLPVRADAVATPDDAKATALEVKALRKSLASLQKQEGARIDETRRSSARLLQVDQAMAFCRAGVDIDPESFEIRGTGIDEIREDRKTASREFERAKEAHAEFERESARRLEAALSLLRAEQVQARVEGAADLVDEAGRLLAFVRTIAPRMEDVSEIVRSCQVLVTLLENAQGRDEDRGFQRALRTRVNGLHESIVEVVEALGETPYPFDHADGDIPLVRYLMSRVPSRRDLNSMLQASSEIQRLLEVHDRAVARLAEIAETAESAIGLGPIDRTGEAAAAGAARDDDSPGA